MAVKILIKSYNRQNEKNVIKNTFFAEKILFFLKKMLYYMTFIADFGKS